MCSDKHCHKSLQIICREKSKDVRIKGKHLLFVSMQDILFFRVVTIYISLRCILLHLCRDVRITLSVVLFGLVTRTLRHRVLVWRFCFPACFILCNSQDFTVVEFGCFRLLAVLSYLIQTYGCAELLFRILYFPVSFSCLPLLTPRAFPKILLFFSQVIFQNILAPD